MQHGKSCSKQNKTAGGGCRHSSRTVYVTWRTCVAEQQFINTEVSANEVLSQSQSTEGSSQAGKREADIVPVPPPRTKTFHNDCYANAEEADRSVRFHRVPARNNALQMHDVERPTKQHQNGNRDYERTDRSRRDAKPRGNAIRRWKVRGSRIRKTGGFVHREESARSSEEAWGNQPFDCRENCDAF